MICVGCHGLGWTEPSTTSPVSAAILFAAALCLVKDKARAPGKFMPGDIYERMLTFGQSHHRPVEGPTACEVNFASITTG